MKPHCFFSPSRSSFPTCSVCGKGGEGGGMSVYGDGKKDNGMCA